MFSRTNPDNLPKTEATAAVVVAGSAYTDATTGTNVTSASLLTVISPTNLANGGFQLPVVTVPRDLLVEVKVYNKAGTNTIAVYPETGGTINGGSANGAVTLASGATATFICTGAATWLASEAPPA